MRLIWVLLGLLIAPQAWAAWAAVGERDASTVYLDPATVRKSTYGRRAWLMSDFKQPQTVSTDTFRSMKHLFEFDCAGERLRILQVSVHSGQLGQGKVVYASNSPQEWSVVSPESNAEIQLKAACSAPLK
jgi:hypothetical protein